MSLGSEPWKIDSHDKVAKIARALSADVGLKFQKDVLYKVFPEKNVNGVDIGKKCADWLYIIATFFDDSEKKSDIDFDTLSMYIIIAYKNGIDLDKDELWHLMIVKYGIPMFVKKISSFAQISRLAFMGELEKKIQKIIEGEDIF